MKFRYPLKALLEKRKREVDRLQKELSNTKKTLMKESSVLEEYINKRDEYERELFSKLERGTDRNEVDLYLDFLMGNEERIHEKRDVILSIEKEMERTLHSLLEASKRKNVLEKIIERAWRKEILEAFRKETLFLDQMAARNYIDRNSGRKG